MLDLIGSVVGLSTIAINLVAIASALPISLRQRLVLAAGAGGWVGLASALAAQGALTFSSHQPVPLIAVLAGTPLLAALLSWFFVPGFREALTAIPTPLMIRLNILRGLGVLFLLLAAAGRLGGPFPYFAGLGDMATALWAVSAARAADRGDLGKLWRWNAFGALDLVVAVGLGLTSAQGGPLLIFDVGAGSQAIQMLPFALVPTVLVPFYLVVHGVVAAQLLNRKRQGAKLAFGISAA